MKTNKIKPVLICALVILVLGSSFDLKDPERDSNEDPRLYMDLPSEPLMDVPMSTGPICAHCHAEMYLEGKKPPSDAIHMSDKAGHREYIEHFIGTHGSAQAASKNVDLEKLIIYFDQL